MATEKRLIDANRIPYHKSGFPKGDGFDSRLDWAFREDIDKLPTVDAVEVVRCFECQKEGTEECPMAFRDCLTGCLCANTKGTDFCSYGERSTANDIRQTT